MACGFKSRHRHHVVADFISFATTFFKKSCLTHGKIKIKRKIIHIDEEKCSGCPKLDGVDYAEKLTEIIRSSDIQSVTVVRMGTLCCVGLEMAAKRALQNSGNAIPCQVITISIDGYILNRNKKTEPAIHFCSLTFIWIILRFLFSFGK